MPYLLLQKLSTFYMPVQMFDPVDVQNVENLRDAGYIKAEAQTLHAGSTRVVVLGLSVIGRTALQIFGCEGPPAEDD